MRRIEAVSDKQQLIHIETPNGIINIRTNLVDRFSRNVDSIEIIPDNFIGEPKVALRGSNNTNLIRLKTINTG